MKIHKEPFCGPVTWSSFSRSGLLLFVGSGSTLFIYDAVLGSLIRAINVLTCHTIHGADFAPEVDCMSDLGVIFGQKIVKLFRNVPQNAAASTTNSFEEIRNFNKLSDWVWDVQILSEEKSKTIFPLLAIGFAHNFVEIWDTENMQCFHSIQCREKCILYSMSFFGRSIDELVVASGTVFQQVILWNPFGNGSASQILDGHDGVIFHIEWSNNGRMIASVSDDRSMYLWHNASSDTLTSAADLSMAFHQDKNENSNRSLADSSLEESIILSMSRSLPRDKLLGTEYKSLNRYWGHSARIWDASFCNYGIVTVSEDALCKLWDFDGNCLATIRGHTGKHIWKINMHPEGYIAVTSGGDGSVKTWNLQQQVHNNPDSEILMPRSFKLPLEMTSSVLSSRRPAVIRGLALDANSVRGYFATDKGEIWCLNIDSNTWETFYAGNLCSCFCTVSIDESDSYLIASDSTGFVYIFLLTSGQLLARWKAHSSRVILTKILETRERVDNVEVTFYTSAVEGLLKEWRLFFPSKIEKCEKFELMMSYRCPSKASSILSITTVRYNETNNYLCCGDGRGNLCLFKRCESHESDPINIHEASWILRGAHGRDQISFVSYRKGCIYSAGHDGYIRIYRVMNNSHTSSLYLDPLRRQPVNGISTIKKIWWTSSSNVCSESDEDMYVFGFHASYAYLWNISSFTQIFKVPCGGWRRPHSVVTNGFDHTLLFSPSSPLDEIRIQTTNYSKSDKTCINNTVQERGFHFRFHGRMATCVKWLDSEMLITGSEDNSLFLHEWKSVGSSRQVTYVDSISMHTTGVRALSISDFTFTEKKFIVSTGGKQVVQAYVYDATDKSIQHLAMHQRGNSGQDQRILCATTLSLPENSPSNGEVHIIGCGNSEGLLSILIMHHESRTLEHVGDFIFTARPIMCCSHVLHQWLDGSFSLLMIAGSTDGQVAIWDVSKLINMVRQRQDSSVNWANWCQQLRPIYAFQAHQMGVNCMSVTMLDNGDDESSTQETRNIFIATGGDDQGVSCAAFKFSLRTESIETCEYVTDVWVNESLDGLKYLTNASGSALKTIYVDENVLIFAGYDQRVNIWKRISNNSYEWTGGERIEVADIAGMDVQVEKNSMYSLVLVGQGMQLVSFVL